MNIEQAYIVPGTCNMLHNEGFQSLLQSQLM